MFLYQQNDRYFAMIAEGLEDIGAEELKQLGARNLRATYRGLYFEADRAALYRINYQSRLVSRVLAPLAAFGCREPQVLYRQARQIPWREIFGVTERFAVFANLVNSQMRHSRYAALCVKDAIVDSFRQETGERPDVERIEPDVWVGVFIENNHAVISLDTSGGPLHRRGYRRRALEAPMQETIAAAVIRLSEWDGEIPLVDPFCGSGTLLAEALMHACRIPAGYLRRRFGFEFLPDFDARRWREVKQTAERRIRPLAEGRIAGSDISAEAVACAAENLRRLPYGEKVQLERIDARHRRDLAGKVIVCNPPYGIRLGKRTSLPAFYQSLGDFLKRRCAGARAFIYFGDRSLIGHLGLRPAWKKPLRAGGLDGRLAAFELYEGSRQDSAEAQREGQQDRRRKGPEGKKKRPSSPLPLRRGLAAGGERLSDG